MSPLTCLASQQPAIAIRSIQLQPSQASHDVDCSMSLCWLFLVMVPSQHPIVFIAARHHAHPSILQCRLHLIRMLHGPLHQQPPLLHHCYLLRLHWFSLEEERVMQQSSVSTSLSFENQGINPVGDDAQVTEYLHKQSRTCNQRDKGVVNPFMVSRKSEI